MEVAAFGFSEKLPGEAVRLMSLEDCFEFGDVIILPIPVTRDGAFLSGSNICISEIKKLCEKYRGKTAVFGGMPPKELEGVVVDFLGEEKYQSISAKLTSDAFFEYLSKENKNISKSETVCVCGYGRIGKEICNTLRKLKIRVKVLTGTPSKHPCVDAVEFYHYDFADQVLSKASRVINTAPCNVISDSAALKMAEDAIYYELASKPFGLSAEAEKILSDRRVYLPGLPGKFFPKESGVLIVDTVMELLEKYHEGNSLG